MINSAYLREAQAKVEHRVANSGMAVLLDAGMEKGIHPAKKQVAGERLALLALTKTYGVEGVNGESPYYKSIEIKNDNRSCQLRTCQYVDQRQELFRIEKLSGSRRR